MTALYGLALVLGLVVGSFLNVCIYRLPMGKSIVHPPSACPACNTPIKPWQNIPLVSYILLGGKCGSCKAPISLRYPMVELINGLFYVFVIHRFGLSGASLVYMALLSSLIVITMIDLKHQIIPDVITLPGIVLGLGASAFVLPDLYKPYGGLLGLDGSAIGALAGGVMFYVIVIVSRGGMGLGDVKMMAMTGAILGWQSVLLTTFVGSFAGSAYGIVLMLFMGKGRKTKVPFGPFLAVGVAVSLFYGRELVQLYLNGFSR